MNAHKYTYQGQEVSVEPVDNAYLVQIGHRIVRVEKSVKVKTKVKLRLIQGGIPSERP